MSRPTFVGGGDRPQGKRPARVEGAVGSVAGGVDRGGVLDWKK